MVGLALSGGGFRASLFHLGVLRRLWEIGLLPSSPAPPAAQAGGPMLLSHISSVSGGSITAALYASLLARRGANFDFIDVERALLGGIGRNLRRQWLWFRFGPLFVVMAGATWALWSWLPRLAAGWRIFAIALVGVALYMSVRTLPLLTWLYHLHFYRGRRLAELPDFADRLRWLRPLAPLVLLAGVAAALWFRPLPLPEPWRTAALPTAAVALYVILYTSDVFRWAAGRLLYEVIHLRDLPVFPRLIINTTSLNTGTGVFFTRDSEASDPAEAFDGGHDKPSTWLAEAVAASAAVPGLFDPLGRRHGYVVDGGVWDNQGASVYFTDPLEEEFERVVYLIVSDASLTLTPIASSTRPFGPFPLQDRIEILMRSATITGDRVRDELYSLLRHKWDTDRLRQFAAFHTLPDLGMFYAYDADYAVPAYDPAYTLPMAGQLIPLVARIRTDLDSFSDLEIRTLMYHGYALVNYTLFSHCWEALGPALAEEVLRAKRTLPDLQGLGAADDAFTAAPLSWTVLRGAAGVAGHLPAMKTWEQFNATLDAEAGDLLRDPRWREFGGPPPGRCAPPPRLLGDAVRSLAAPTTGPGGRCVTGSRRKGGVGSHW